MTFKELLTHLQNISENDPELLEIEVFAICGGNTYTIDIALHMNENCLYLVEAIVSVED